MKRDSLLQNIAAACGPNYRTEVIEGSNQTWPNSNAGWCYEFTDRMTTLLADQLDYVYRIIMQSKNDLIKQLEQHESHQLDAVKDLLNVQRSWLQEVVKQSEEFNKAEHLRLNTLWWCEALYSTSLCCSYRDIDQVLAAAVIPFDLLSEVQCPTPASVTYALSETVAKLANAEFGKEYKFDELLGMLIEKSSTLPETWAQKIDSPPKIGRLSLRDQIIAVLQGEKDINLLMQRSGLKKNSLSAFPDCHRQSTVRSKLLC